MTDPQGVQAAAETDSRPLPERLREGFTDFMHTEVAGAVALLVATAIALIFANSAAHGAYEAFWHIEAGFAFGPIHVEESLLNWINDALMALFLFVVGLEIKREVLVGELSEWRKALLPVLGALGGMVVPAVIYLAFNAGGPGVRGWGIPMATDIAFAIGIMALLGERVPTGLKVFLVALAIADDIGSILVIAIAYSNNVQWVWLAWAAAAFVLLIAFNRSGVDSPWPYFIVGGVLWLCVFLSGVHATIAGVLVAITIPTTARVDPLDFTRTTRERLDRIEASHVPGASVICNDTQQLVAYDIRKEARHTASPLQRMEYTLHPWTTFVVLPLFALANAGVRVVGVDVGAVLRTPIALGIIVGLVVGKPLGITLAAFGARAVRIVDLPEGVSWPQMIGAAMLGGIGFTMSLLIATMAFPGSAETMAAKTAILTASLAAGVLGYIALRSVLSPPEV